MMVRRCVIVISVKSGRLWNSSTFWCGRRCFCLFSVLKQLFLVLLVLDATSTVTSTSTKKSIGIKKDKDKVIPNRSYFIIGVSGGLQDGFPAHTKLDYYVNNNDPSTLESSGEPEISKAILLGRGLVRGYKAFLDVMEEGWREYTYEPNQPVINSNVFASGCYEHANEYWIYLIDTRQVMSVLNNEPRFLSITPDTGQISLIDEELIFNNNHDSGSPHLVKQFLLHQINKQKKSNKSNVAIPLVTAVYFNSMSHVPSPPIRTLINKNDGFVTEVTNFPDSLALWANVSDADRTAVLDEETQCRHRHRHSSNKQDNTTCSVPSDKAMDAYRTYWNGIRTAVRNAEEHRYNTTMFGPPFQCQRQVRFGVDNNTARLNIPLTAKEIINDLQQINNDIASERGYQLDDINTWEIDFDEGEIVQRTPSLDESA